VQTRWVRGDRAAYRLGNDRRGEIAMATMNQAVALVVSTSFLGVGVLCSLFPQYCVDRALRQTQRSSLGRLHHRWLTKSWARHVYRAIGSVSLAAGLLLVWSLFIA